MKIHILKSYVFYYRPFVKKMSINYNDVAVI